MKSYMIYIILLFSFLIEIIESSPVNNLVLDLKLVFSFLLFSKFFLHIHYVILQKQFDYLNPFEVKCN